MSAITIVRRYKCWEVRESPRDPNSSLFIRQEGFLQICGSTDLREMLIISDQISSLKLYKLSCNCQYCTSFYHETMTDSRVTTEMFMNAVNIIFSTLSKFGYEMQSTSSMQNHDGSNSVTWIWINRKPK